MSLQHVKNVAAVFHRANIPLYLFGAHGIGKTSAIYQMFMEIMDKNGAENSGPAIEELKAHIDNPESALLKKDMKVVSSFEGKHFARAMGDKDSFRFWSMSAPNITVEEIIGMPHVQDRGAMYQEMYLKAMDTASRLLMGDANGDTTDAEALFALQDKVLDRMSNDLGLTKDDQGQLKLQYLRTSGLMPPADHRGGGIWLIDELNRGFVEVEKAFMQILLERRYLDYVLPDDVWICTTMNPSGAGYKVREMDPAVLDRAGVITVKSDNKDFLDYAASREMNEMVRMFADENSTLVNKHEEDLNLDIDITATNRSLEMLAKCWDVMSEREVKEVGLSVANALIGRDAASVYHKMATERTLKPLTVEDVVEGYGWTKWEDDKEYVVKKGSSRKKFKGGEVVAKNTDARKRVKKMVNKTNVKAELLNITLANLKTWVEGLHKELMEKESSKDDDKHTDEQFLGVMNILLFLFDIPADISRQFLMEDLDTLYEIPFYFAGKHKILADLFKKIQQDYKNASEEKSGE